MARILVIGATSAIAKAVARRFAARGDALFLAARDGHKLSALADDLRIRGAHQVHTSVLDVNDDDRQATVLDDAWRALTSIDIVLVAHGTLPGQPGCDRSVEEARAHFTTNATSTIMLLVRLAPRMETQGHGCIAVITSVAADRGRAVNRLYASAKAAVHTYLGGLRQHLARAGVDVISLKPGLVDTPMTRDLAKGMLFSSPERVADGILRALDLRPATAYLPGYWRWIMWTIRSLPDKIFNRLRF